MSDILRVPEFPRIDDWIGCWSIEPLAGRVLSEMVQAVLRAGLKVHVDEGLPPAPKVEVFDAKGGAKIAVIPLVGTLMKSGSSMGGTSTVQADLTAGLDST